MVDSMADVDEAETPKGTPVGRRVFLGMLGLGAAGIVWGAKVQSSLERLLRPITLNDRTGSPRSCRRPAASASTRSPAHCPP